MSRAATATGRYRHRMLALGLATLAGGMAVAVGVASEGALQRKFTTALTARDAPVRTPDARLTSGFDVSAVHLGRHDDSASTGDAHGRPFGVLDALARTPHIGDRVMVTSVDGRVDTLEVVATSPLPSGFDDRTAPPDPDGASANAAFARRLVAGPSLILVTFRAMPTAVDGIADYVDAEHPPQLVRMVLEIPRPTTPLREATISTPKAL